MKVGIAADHAGFELKNRLAEFIRRSGSEVVDFGAASYEPDDDYPDRVLPLAQAVVAATVDRGIAICGSGVGASIVANKVGGVRAAICHDAYSARQGVEHDDMNLLVLGSRIIGPALAETLVDSFLKAVFSGEERHRRRLEKLAKIEKRRFD